MLSRPPAESTRVLLILASLVVIAVGIRLAAFFLAPLLLGMFVVLATVPFVSWLRSRGVPEILAVTLGLFVDILAGLALCLPLIIAATTLYERLPSYQAKFLLKFDNIMSWFQAHGRRSESLSDLVDPQAMVNFASSFLQNVAGMFSQLLLVFLVTGFLLFESRGFREKITRTTNREQLHALSAAAQEVNTYLFAKLILSLITGLVVFLWCWISGIDVPVFWGLLACVLNFIPTIGQLIAAIPAVMLAWIQFDTAHAIGVAGGFIAINLAFSMIEPRVMGDALGLSALVVFISMILWAWLLGPIGALLSAPLTMFIKYVLAQTRSFSWVADLLGPSPTGKTIFPPRTNRSIPPPLRRDSMGL